MEDADELALFLRALLFRRLRISLLVRVDFPSFVLNSRLVLHREFFFYRWNAVGVGVWS